MSARPPVTFYALHAAVRNYQELEPLTAAALARGGPYGRDHLSNSLAHLHHLGFLDRSEKDDDARVKEYRLKPEMVTVAEWSLYDVGRAHQRPVSGLTAPNPLAEIEDRFRALARDFSTRMESGAFAPSAIILEGDVRHRKALAEELLLSRRKLCADQKRMPRSRKIRVKTQPYHADGSLDPTTAAFRHFVGVDVEQVRTRRLPSTEIIRGLEKQDVDVVRVPALALAEELAAGVPLDGWILLKLLPPWTSHIHLTRRDARELDEVVVVGQDLLSRFALQALEALGFHLSGKTRTVKERAALHELQAAHGRAAAFVTEAHMAIPLRRANVSAKPLVTLVDTGALLVREGTLAGRLGDGPKRIPHALSKTLHEGHTVALFAALLPSQAARKVDEFLSRPEHLGRSGDPRSSVHVGRLRDGFLLASEDARHGVTVT